MTQVPEIDTTVPHSARVWNYLLGGKDNYEVDREAAEAAVAVYPAVRVQAQQSRQFLIRVVRYLVNQAGIRQFLDIGTGLPTMQNTHEVAQAVAPESQVVYVDNDPLVLAHARALLTSKVREGTTAYIDADVHDPDRILTEARKILDFDQPIAVMFMGILGFVADYDEARSIVSRVMSAVPPGSHLALWDSVDDPAADEALDDYADTGAIPYNTRSPEKIAGFTEGLELVEPGVSMISVWRPDAADIGSPPPLFAYGAVARKP